MKIYEFDSDHVIARSQHEFFMVYIQYVYIELVISNQENIMSNQQAHENASKQFDQAAKHHAKAAEFCAANKHGEAADSAIKANSCSNQGYKAAQEAADLHAKTSTLKS
jgi:hypothetical protein